LGYHLNIVYIQFIVVA